MNEIDKLIGKTGPTYVFADESGKLSDPKQNIPVDARLITWIHSLSRYFSPITNTTTLWLTINATLWYYTFGELK
jgi:hypothetical protein